jgi:hypothetical protein
MCFVSAINKQAQSIGSKLVYRSCNSAYIGKKGFKKAFRVDYAAYGVSGEQILDFMNASQNMFLYYRK